MATLLLDRGAEANLAANGWSALTLASDLSVSKAGYMLITSKISGS